jgi:hypothetical protein
VGSSLSGTSRQQGSGRRPGVESRSDVPFLHGPGSGFGEFWVLTLLASGMSHHGWLGPLAAEIQGSYLGLVLQNTADPTACGQ